MDPTQTLPPMNPLLAAAEELDETKVTPGVLGFLVFAALGVAVWMLLKSMNRQIQRIDFEGGAAAPAREPEPAPAPPAGRADQADEAGGAADRPGRSGGFDPTSGDARPTDGSRVD